MALVERRFRDNFEAWAAMRIAHGDLTEQDIAELRETIRMELTPGPDTVRAGVWVVADGHVISGQIDDRDERYRLWDEFFEAELEDAREGLK